MRGFTDEQDRLIANLGVPRETVVQLDDFVARLIAENERQNLIARTSVPEIWNRHIADSAQLKPHIGGKILDIGSGAGLPGIVLAILGCQMTLLEPRRLRADFLRETAAALGLDAAVCQTTVGKLKRQTFDTITARAYAPLTKIFETAHHLSHAATRWVLPKGRNAMSELEVARATWHGDFRTIPSITDPDAMIVIAEGVRPKAQR